MTTHPKETLSGQRDNTVPVSQRLSSLTPHAPLAVPSWELAVDGGAMATPGALQALAAGLNFAIKATEFAVNRAQQKALAQVVAFDESGKQKAVPVNLSLSTRVNGADWVWVGFLPDEDPELVPRRPPFKVRLGTKLRAELMPGHYEIRAFFCAPREGMGDRYLLRAYGSQYVLHAAGKMQTLEIKGHALDADRLAEIREMPKADEIFILPSLPPRLLDSHAVQRADNPSTLRPALRAPDPLIRTRTDSTSALRPALPGPDASLAPLDLPFLRLSRGEPPGLRPLHPNFLRLALHWTRLSRRFAIGVGRGLKEAGNAGRGRECTGSAKTTSIM